MRRRVAMAVAVHCSLIAVGASIVLPRAVAGAAQGSTTANQDEVVFDVASVRPDRRERGPLEPPGMYLRMLPGGRFEANTTLRRLLVFAFELRPHQRVEGFEALLDERFAIVARVADGVTLTEGDERRLVRQLLADRFKLRVRFDDRTEEVAFLRRVDPDRLGPGLRPSPLDCSVEVPPNRDLDSTNPFRRCTNSFFNNNGRVAMVVPSMAAFARHLSGPPWMRAVIDETGLTGPWEIDITYRPVPSFPGIPAEYFDKWPPLEVALRTDLGLRLDTAPGIVSHLVIEHVEAPSPD